MEDKSSLFSLSIDTVTKAHLSETAKWARYFAIAGFIVLILSILIGVYSAIMISRYEDGFRSGLGMSNAISNTGISLTVVYIIIAVIAFFPLYFILRFANLMQHAIAGNEQALLVASFKSLKLCFRYLAIITIIVLTLIALSLLVGTAGMALS